MTTEYPYKLNDQNVRFIYLKDAKQPKRVATVAFVRQGDKLFYSWAINRVQAETYYEDAMMDAFDKATGRKIALGRLALERSRREVEIVADEKYIATILKDIVAGPLDGHEGERGYIDGVLTAPDGLAHLARVSMKAYEARLADENVGG